MALTHTSTSRPGRDKSGLQMVWISRLFLVEGNGSEYRAAILEHLNAHSSDGDQAFQAMVITNSRAMVIRLGGEHD